MAAAAFARSRRAQHQPSAEPNVIPFIDVLLVLLIIFMVTAPRPTVDLQVDMPRNAPTVIPIIPPTTVELREDEGGYAIFVEERRVILEALGAAVMARVLAAEPALTEQDARNDARIYVRAEQGIAYGDVVGVIDELQHVGFEKVGVFAQTAEPS